MSSLGLNIKHIRMSRNISQVDLANMVGITPSFLCQIENEKNAPSLQTLKKIAEALEVPISCLIVESRDRDQRKLVRQNERTRITGMSDNKVTIEYLTDIFPGNNMEACIHILKPNSVSGSEINTHIGQEIWFLLEGEVTIFVGEERHKMLSGDCYYVRSCNEIHLISNDSESLIAKMLCITTPPVLQFSKAKAMYIES